MKKINTQIITRAPLALVILARGALVVVLIVANIFLMWPVLTTYAAVTQKVPTENGLVGYWSMNEGAGDKIMDMSGNGKTGTITGATWVTGKYGKALRFNGSDQFVTMPTTGSGIFNPNGTVSFWAKPEVMNGAWHGVVTQGSNDAGFWWVGVYAGNWTVYTNAGTGFLESSIPATPGNWYHIVAKQDGTNLTLYVNGVALTPVAFSGGGTTRELFFGRTQDYSEFYAGTLDDVRIYNRALSATEISNLYKSGTTKINVPTPPSNNSLGSGLVGYWTMDGKDINGTTLTDRSGLGNNGTNNGATPTIGKTGQALRFKSNEHILISPALNSTNTYTTSVWVRINGTTPDGYQCILSQDYNNNILCYGDSEKKFLAYANYSAFYTDTTYPIGKWYHVSVVHNPTTQYIYIDGVLAGTSSNTNASSLQYIGSAENTVETLNGDLDEVRIYNRALSATEIYNLYKQGAVALNVSPTTRLTDGLVGYWTFDGKDTNLTTATDLSGNGNNGTISGATPAIGKIGQALKFQHASGFVSATDSASLKPANVSVSAWVYLTSNNDGYIVLKDKGLGASYELTAGRDGSSANFNFCSYVSGAFTCAIYPKTLNTWKHLVGVYDGTNRKLYVDGVLQSTVAGGAIDYTSPNPLYIGGYTPANQNIDGKIDEVRIYNRALSATEIKQLYLMGK